MPPRPVAVAAVQVQPSVLGVDLVDPLGEPAVGLPGDQKGSRQGIG
jgi:hypothetical protein